MDQFEIDWQQKQARCPQGKLSSSWNEGVDNTGRPLIYAVFRTRDCKPCPARTRCTRTQRRQLGFRPKEQFEALQEARRRFASEAGRQFYHRRAGVEGTVSQGVRAFGLRQNRYRGLAKTQLQHIATAAAINFDRIAAWLEEIPRSMTRISRFAALAPV